MNIYILLRDVDAVTITTDLPWFCVAFPKAVNGKNKQHDSNQNCSEYTSNRCSNDSRAGPRWFREHYHLCDSVTAG